MDFEKEKRAFIAELEAGEYDIDIFPNEESDYQQNINDDVQAFSDHLNSEGARTLSAEVFG